MSGRPSISVVVPCYNAARYVGAALRSVYAQGWPDLEVIVVDDGSTDDSADRVRRGFPQVKLLRQRNQGVAAARNAGITQARGEWVAFLDADDIWLPEKLAAQWAALERVPDARMAYTAWVEWMSDDEGPSPEYLAALHIRAGDPSKWIGPSGWIYPQLLLDCEVWTSTVLAHRSLLAEIGPMDVGLRVGEDWDLWLRASQASQIVRVSRPLALYRLHQSSLTKAPLDKNYRSVLITRALQRWGYRSVDGTAARKEDVRRGLARSWIDFASGHLRAGSLSLARRGALTSLRYDPLRPDAWKLLAKSMLHSVLAPQSADR